MDNKKIKGMLIAIIVITAAGVLAGIVATVFAAVILNTLIMVFGIVLTVLCFLSMAFGIVFLSFNTRRERNKFKADNETDYQRDFGKDRFAADNESEYHKKK